MRFWAGATYEFQFTHPGKGATQAVYNAVVVKLCFNSRTLGRVRLSFVCSSSRRASFNSRTLGRVRLVIRLWQRHVQGFQFTHPGKGATLHHNKVNIYSYVSIHAPWEGCDEAYKEQALVSWVSIHAPWEGCDSKKASTIPIRLSFNSRTLGRVRHDEKFNWWYANMFQFTHPGKGATTTKYHEFSIDGFQFTHPGKGATVMIKYIPFRFISFNSRTLGRVRLFFV